MEEAGRTSFETLKLTIGEDQLFVEAMPPNVFGVEERDTVLGRIYNHWLEVGEPTENSFLLPYEAHFRPRRLTTDDEKRMIIEVDLDEDGYPLKPQLDEAGVIGCPHPFGGFTLASLYDCTRHRLPLYFHISMQLSETEVDFTRLLLPSVDERDRISRIDVVHRITSGFEQAEGNSERWKTT